MKLKRRAAPLFVQDAAHADEAAKSVHEVEVLQKSILLSVWYRAVLVVVACAQLLTGFCRVEQGVTR